jgi:hypothetical protein
MEARFQDLIEALIPEKELSTEARSTLTVPLKTRLAVKAFAHRLKMSVWKTTVLLLNLGMKELVRQELAKQRQRGNSPT